MSQQQRRSLPGVGQERASLPTGGEFSPSGIIGPWTAGIFWSLYTEVDLGQYNQQVTVEERLNWAKSNKRGGGTWYYFATAEEAAKAKEPAQNKYGANRIWYFQTERDQILNFADPDALAKWGQFPSSDCNLKTPGSKKYGHEFHLISLPKAVHAAAVFYGYEVPDYSLGELLDRNAVFSDDFYADMCGDPDVKGSWVDSVLGRRRAALWAALGETNPSRYVIGAIGQYGTEAPQLVDCLQIANNIWTAPMWARVVFVPDPRVDAVFGGEDKRVTLPALFEIFPDEAAAREVAVKEVAEFKARQAGQAAAEPTSASAPAAPAPAAPAAPRPPAPAAPQAPSPAPPVPAKWAEYGSDFWANWLSQPPPEGVAGVDAVEAAKLAEVDVADINAWRKHLGIV
jgi:hypothetical protein